MRNPILLDVDGVLNVLPRYDRLAHALGTLQEADIRWPEGVEEHPATTADGREVILRIRPETRALVTRLAEAGQIVWCTSWWQNVDEVIAPLVGLPPGLPRVELPDSISGDGPGEYPIKAPFVRLWAADHGVERLCWIDDDLFGAEQYLALPTFQPGSAGAARMIADEARTGSWRREWQRILGHTPPVQAVCVRVDPCRGLTEDVVARVETWRRQ